LKNSKKNSRKKFSQEVGCWTGGRICGPKQKKKGDPPQKKKKPALGGAGGKTHRGEKEKIPARETWCLPKGGAVLPVQL